MANILVHMLRNQPPKSPKGPKMKFIARRETEKWFFPSILGIYNDGESV